MSRNKWREVDASTIQKTQNYESEKGKTQNKFLVCFGMK